MAELSYVMGNVTQIEANLVALDYAAVNASLLNAENSLSNAISNLTLAEGYMDDAVNLGGMTQLSTSLAAIGAINSGLGSIQTNIDNLQSYMSDPVGNSALIDAELASLLSNLADINSDLQDVTAQ